MRYTDEWKLRESFEKWPPAWGDTIFGEDDEDEEEQENKRCRNRSSVKSSFKRQ
jgi:hypothetical protein